MTQRDAATQRQIAAAQPDQSTWLSANAGSGKTKVLTDRVARLLLDGVNPQHILCLTYTKAAASEMQNRLFKRLGEWAMLDDALLIQQLHQLGEDSDFGDGRLRDARRLFASAIEAPGGLKIQTIHSFCAALLRRFPLEAGVSSQFVEMEDRTAALLRAEIVEDIAAGPDAQVIFDVARHYAGETFEDLTNEVVRHRTEFGADGKLHETLGVVDGDSLETLSQAVFLGSERAILDQVVPVLLASGKMDQTAGSRLGNLTALDASDLLVLEKVFLTGASAKEPFTAKLGSFPTKGIQKALAHIMPELEAWMMRVEDARERRLALGAVAKTRALHSFAQVFLPAYGAAKMARGWLDFDDLILRARDLLTDDKVAAWVLFRLDGGIDHILVDEAQDTSPVQWQVIERLAQEFTSGAGARTDVLRTIFVVGDKKQSIYSFQGADPREFDRMQDEFAEKLAAVEHPLQSHQLEHSFRSSQAILDLVDQTFIGREGSGFSTDQSHKAFKSNLPGRVDLWPITLPPDNPDDPPWETPVDVKANSDPDVVLANRIADQIAGMIANGHAIPDDSAPGDDFPSRPVHAGDFLILVQRRADLFHEIIRACKTRELPIAGADRLKVGAELAVKDLAALLSFLATPEDDLSLAVALKSPLFGWDEQDLYHLAQGRAQKYLWHTLRDTAEEYPGTMAVISDLRAQVDYLRPYDLIERILTRHDGRRKLLGRLGPEAEDGIDALLSQALAYEQKAVDSLTGFLVWLETDDLEIKRQMDSAGDRIRVMTVHGAKGLEAPIVILPDTGKRTVQIRDQIVAKDGVALWRTKADETPTAVANIANEMKAAQLAERDRLLYVAMTRAEKWLIVAAAGDPGTKGESWYESVRAGLERCNASPHDFDAGEGLRLEYGEWDQPTDTVVAESAVSTAALDAFFKHDAPVPIPAISTLSPSDLGGAKALPGEQGMDEDAALRRGRLVHLLLEFLPDVQPDDWGLIAQHLFDQTPDVTVPEERALLLAEATKVLTKDSLAPLFAQSTLSEVSVSAPVSALDGVRIHGVIDRLVVEDDRVLIVDFKTNALVPDTPQDCPDGLLRQLGAYAAAISDIYPGHKIETAILWTRTASLMMLPHDLVTDAISNTQIS